MKEGFEEIVNSDKVISTVEADKMRSNTKLLKQKFKLSSDVNRKGKKVAKSDKMILVEYISLKGDIRFLIVPIVNDYLIIRNKVHYMNPKAVQNMRVGLNKNYKVLVIKEGDMLPVSNLDYDELISMGRATNNHELLIKAALSATLVEGAKKMANKAIIAIGIAAVVGIGIYMFFSAA